MKVRALKSFATLECTLSRGQIADMSQEVAQDLLACGYIEEVIEEDTKDLEEVVGELETEFVEEKEIIEVKTPEKKVKKDESK